MGRLTLRQGVGSLLGVLRTAKPLARGGRNATGLLETAGLPNRAPSDCLRIDRPELPRRPAEDSGCTEMIRRLQKTFDWDYLVRFLAAATVVYVLGVAALRSS